MGLFSSDPEYGTVEITEEWLDSGKLSPSDQVNEGLYIMPHEDDGGLDVGKSLLTSLHQPEIERNGLLGRKKANVTPATAFEMTYSKKAMGFEFVSRNDSAIATIEGQLDTLLPNSDYERRHPHLLDFQEGHHIAAAELALRDYTLLPIRRRDLDGFESDPLGSIAAEMIGLVSDEIPPAEVTVQTVLKPADSDWTNGVNGEGDISQIAEDLEADNIRHPWHPTKYNVQDPSKVEEKTAKLVRNQEGRHGWWFNIRIIAASEDPDEAKRRVEKTGNMYKQFYNSESNQGFRANGLSGDAIKECVENAIERKYVRPAEPLLKSETEITGLVHIPDGDVNTRDLERATTKGDSGVPPSAPTFKDFDQTGYTDKEIPRRSWDQQQGDQWDWPYAVQMDDEDDYLPVNSHEYGINAHERGTSGDVYAGAYSRAMIENATNTNQPYWAGLDSRSQTVPILHKESFRHTFVTGQTGTGKSTYVVNRLNQHALKGHGFAFVDPGGEDCFELLKMLPEDRLDDVVFIDITRNDAGEKTEDSRHIGFNFLETHHTPDEKGFNAEVEGIISDILPLLEAGEYQRMKGVAANILRALIRANYADTGYTFTLLDMYYILSDEEGRQRYAQFVREEEVDQFLEIFADEVAKLDDSDLEPLIRRLQTWIENAMIRPIVSERNPEFSIAETVEENKILIVKCDTGDDVRQMVSSTITRKIWSVVTARPSRTERFLEGETDIDVPDPLKEASAARGARMDENGDEDLSEEDAGDGTSPKADAGVGEIHVDDLDISADEVRAHEELILKPDGRVEANKQAQAEHDPYYLVIDELHAVLSEESQVDQMLAEARKKRLGLILLTQQTNQLADKQRQRIMSNCSTLMAFNPGNDGIERGAIAAGFSGLGKDDLGLDRYHAWTMITDKAGSLSEPFVVQMLPPYPPKRDLAELREIIDRSLDKYGTELKSDAEIHGEVPDQFSGGGEALGGLDASDLVDGGLGGPDAAGADLGSQRGQQALYEAIHTVQIRADALGEFVPSEDVKAEWQRRTDDDSYDSIPSNLIESNSYIKQTRRGGTVMLNITHEGLEQAGLNYDTGSSASGGKDDHRMVLQFAQQAFTKLGLKTWLPEQEGEEDPDGLGDLPISPSDASSFREVDQLKSDLREELIEMVGSDAIVDYTDGRGIAIEAETSTMEAPEQTLTNLRKALDDDRFCIFACKDEHAKKDDTFYWPKRGERIIYDTYRDGMKHVPDHEKTTYAREIDDDDNRTFYNRKKGYFSIEEGVFVLRKRSQLEQEREQTVEIVWEEEGNEDDRKIVLRDRGIPDGEGGYEQDPQRLLTFDDPETIENTERADVEAYYTYDQEEELYIVRHDGNVEEYETEDQLLQKWARFYPPFIPEVNFPRDPREDDYMMVVFPDDDNPEYDEPMTYKHGEVTPLFPDELSMPEIPDAEEMPDAEETEGGAQSTEGDGQAGGTAQPSTGDIDDEQVADLAEAVADADGISPQQARMAAKRVAEVPVDWEMQVSMATQAARNITVDGGDGARMNGGDATASADGSQPTPGQSGAGQQAQQGQQGGQSGSSPQQPTTTDQPASPQADGAHGQATTGSTSASANDGGNDNGDTQQYTDASDGATGFSRVDGGDAGQRTDGGAQAQSQAQAQAQAQPGSQPAESGPESAATNEATPEGQQQSTGQHDAEHIPDETASERGDTSEQAASETNGETPDREGGSSTTTTDADADDSTNETDSGTVSPDTTDDPDTSTVPDTASENAPDTTAEASEGEDEDEDDEQLTFREEMDQRVADDGDEETEADKVAHAAEIAEVYLAATGSENEASRKAQEQVLGEVRYDTSADLEEVAEQLTNEQADSPTPPTAPTPAQPAQVDQESTGSDDQSTPDQAADRADDHDQSTTDTPEDSNSPTPAQVDETHQQEGGNEGHASADDGSPASATSTTASTATDEATVGASGGSGGDSTTDTTADTTGKNDESESDHEAPNEDSTPPDREGDTQSNSGSDTPPSTGDQSDVTKGGQGATNHLDENTDSHDNEHNSHEGTDEETTDADDDTSDGSAWI